MLIPRVIPSLLLLGGKLVKTFRFKQPTYLGDPINVIRIFNDKEVDELVLLDIGASGHSQPPNYELLRQVTSECFMPLAYGGGVRSLDMVGSLLTLGVEKVIINTAAAVRPEFVREAADRFGSSTIVVSADVRHTLLRGAQVHSHRGSRNIGVGPVEYARRIRDLGAGELLLNSVDRDGTMRGYDLDLIRAVGAAVDIPVIAAGGARSTADFKAAVDAGASAVAAGAMFVFQGPHRAVLITFPPRQELERLFATAPPSPAQPALP